MEDEVNMKKDVETPSLQLQGMEETVKSASILEDQVNTTAKVETGSVGEIAHLTLGLGFKSRFGNHMRLGFKSRFGNHMRI